MKGKLLISLALPLLGASSLLAQTKPNVLFIMTDQQSYNMMSCMGNKWLKTPNMDKIAKMGYRFDKTYCVNPVCMPSRFSLLTGHYASEAGVKENTTVYDAQKVEQIVANNSLGVIFRKAGYETRYSGKLHLYGTKDVSEYGFTLNGIDPYDGPAIYAEKLLAEKGKAKGNQPFLLFLSFLNPHDICAKVGIVQARANLNAEHTVEPARILELQKKLSPEEYRGQIPPRPTNTSPINGEHPEMVAMDVSSRVWNESQWDLYSWMYHRLTESVDAQIGRVLTALKKAGLEENTIIIFTSDHGDMNGAHGLALKNVLFEECQRVPLIFAGKGIKANFADKSTLVCNGLDFMPTICDLVGITPPNGLAGISLKPYLTGEGQKPDRKYIVTEDFNGYQIHDGRYKYTIYELPGYPETLTDLKSEPGETRNFVNDPAYKEMKTQLSKELMANLSKRGLTPLPQDRTISHLRNLEKDAKGKKGGKQKSKITEDQ